MAGEVIMAAAADHLKRFVVFGGACGALSRPTPAPAVISRTSSPHIPVRDAWIARLAVASDRIECSRPFRDLLCDREARSQAGGLDAEQIDEPADPVLILGLN